MICPLLSSPLFVLCQSTGCGWWDNVRQCCAVIPVDSTDDATVGARPDSDVELSGGPV